MMRVHHIATIFTLLLCYTSITSTTANSNLTSTATDDILDVVNKVGEFLTRFHDDEDHDAVGMIIDALNSSSALYTDRQCQSDLLQWRKDLALRQRYAQKMRDSWATRQGGIFEGNVRWPGHYYECINSVGSNISGKHCTTYYGRRYVPIVNGVPMDVSFGTCFPASCSNETVNTVVKYVTHNNTRIRQLTTRCEPTTNYQLDAFGYVSIVLISMYVLFALVGTTLDIKWQLEKDHKEESTSRRVALCFSVLRGGRKVLSTKQPPGIIHVIDGLRVISTLWVILGHSYAFVINRLDNPVEAGRVIINSFGYMAIINGSFSVDTFMCIGGLLAAYLLTKRVSKTGKMDNVLMLYLHRYLRLTPAMAICLLSAVGLFKFMGSGPTWDIYVNEAKAACYNDWWTNLLYINNLYPSTNHCFQHTWYLAVDMQFYIIAPFFVYLFWKNAFLGFAGTFLILAGSVSSVVYVASQYNIMPTPLFYSYLFEPYVRLFMGRPQDESYSFRFQTDIYFVPWARVGVYMIGMLTGFLLFRTKKKIRMSKIFAFIGWVLAIGSGFACVYGLYGIVKDAEPLSKGVNTFYNSASRPAWALSVSWVIVACTVGYGGPVTTLLSWKAFVPLSKMTFSAYLLHPFVIYWYYGGQEQLTHFSNINMSFIYIGQVVYTFAFAFIFAIVVEWPTMEVIKLLLPSKKPPSSKKEQEIKRAEELNSITIAEKKSENVRNGSLSNAKQSPSESKTYTNRAFTENTEF